MARFFGYVGFARTEQTDYQEHPGVWEPVITEKPYYGDTLRNTRRWDQNGRSTNDDLVINNTISIVADTFAERNKGAMKYVRWNGDCWTITSIELQRPRIIITIGGLYNGPEGRSPSYS